MNNKRDSFIFYRSFFEAIEKADKESQLIVYRAIATYSLNREEPQLNGIAGILWTLIKPQIDANWKRFINGCKGGIYGNKGGAPKGNKNAKTKKQQNNPTAVVFSTPNVNDNVNVNNIYDESKDSSNMLPFEDIWQLYGKKGNKKTSLRKWNKLSITDRKKVVEYIPLYIDSTPDKQYRKNFETFLNQECWNDELPINEQKIKEDEYTRNYL